MLIGYHKPMSFSLAAILALQLGDELAEPAPKRVDLAPMALTASVTIEVTYDVEPPKKVNARAPRRTWIGDRSLRHPPGGSPVSWIITPADVRNGQVRMRTNYVVCEDRENAPCFQREVEFVLPVHERDTSIGRPTDRFAIRTPHFSASEDDAARQ